MIKKGGWYIVPAAFFLLLNFSASSAKGLFAWRLVFFLFLSALFSLCSRLRLEKLLAPVCAGGALILFSYGIVQKLVLFPLILSQDPMGSSFHAQALRARIASGRIFAVFSLPTLYAMVCGLLLLLSIHFFFKARPAGRCFWGVLFLLGGINLVLTESFGGILFFTVGIVFYLFASRTFQLKYFAPLLMVVSLVFFLVVALRFQEAREFSPARLRFANWAQAGRVIAGAPLLGVGLGNYEAAVASRVRANEPASIYAHNFFLQLAAEIGLPLMLLLLLLCWPWLRTITSRLLQPQNALFAAAAIQLVLFNLFDVGSYFFIAGVVAVIAFSQLGNMPRPVTPRHAWPAAVLAALLLLHAVATDRQRQGDLWLGRQEYRRAAALYRTALRLDPLSHRSRIGLGHIAWEGGSPAELSAAERHFNAVLRLFPGHPFANHRLSQLAWRCGLYLTAQFHARVAAGANPKRAEYRQWHDHVQNHVSRQLAQPAD